MANSSHLAFPPFRYKGKTYRSSIKIVRLADLIPDFCRKVCLKLQCCPNLVGPTLVPEKCPESCFVQTKTKYSEWGSLERLLFTPLCAAQCDVFSHFWTLWKNESYYCSVQRIKKQF